MLVSTTAIDITPHCPVKLCGYINDIRLAQRTQTAHAPIYAIALRLVLENSQLLILTMDILSIMKNRAEQIKDSITQAYSKKRRNIHPCNSYTCRTKWIQCRCYGERI